MLIVLRLNINYSKNLFLRMSSPWNNPIIIYLISKMIKLNLKVNLEDNHLKDKILSNVKINIFNKIRLTILKPKMIKKDSLMEAIQQKVITIKNNKIF
jgi:hypothetical protein